MECDKWNVNLTYMDNLMMKDIHVTAKQIEIERENESPPSSVVKTRVTNY